jgi:hypothetical protein
MKTNPTKKAIFKKLEELNDLIPEQRVGQMLYNYVLAQCPSNDPFYIEDKDFLNILCKAAESVKELKEIEQDIYATRKKIAKKH